MPKITPTITPTIVQVSSNTSASSNTFGTYVVDLIENLVNVDAILLLKVLLIWLLIIWLVFAVWVLYDAFKRYKNIIAPVLWFLFILPFNFLGFLGYFFVRPTYTKEEQEALDLDHKLLEYEISNLVFCPTCGSLQGLNNKHCYHCGESLRVVCPSCKKEMSINYYFCTSCGTKLPGHTAVALDHAPQNKHFKTVVTSSSQVTNNKNFAKKKKYKKFSLQKAFKWPYKVLLWWGQNVYIALYWLGNTIMNMANSVFKAISFPFVYIYNVVDKAFFTPQPVEKSKKRLSKIEKKDNKPIVNKRKHKKHNKSGNKVNK